MMVNIKTMSCNVVDAYQCSGGSYCLHFQGRSAELLLHEA